MISVFHRQWKAFFHSWMFFAVCAALFAALGVLVVTFHGAYGYSNVEYLLFLLMVVFSLLLPLLTSFVFKEERKRSIQRFLRTLPLSERDVVLGKYLSFLALIGGFSAILLLLPMLLGLWGTVNYASAYMAIFGFFLFALALLSVNFFLALCFKNPWISLSVSYGVTALLIAQIYLTDLLPSAIGDVLESFSLFGVYAPFIYGITDLRAVVLYLSVGALFLLLTVFSSEKLWKE